MMSSTVPDELAFDTDLLRFVEQDSEFLVPNVSAGHDAKFEDAMMLLEDGDMPFASQLSDTNDELFSLISSASLTSEQLDTDLMSNANTAAKATRSSPSPDTDQEDSEIDSIGMPSPSPTFPQIGQNGSSSMQWPSSPSPYVPTTGQNEIPPVKRENVGVDSPSPHSYRDATSDDGDDGEEEENEAEVEGSEKDEHETHELMNSQARVNSASKKRGRVVLDEDMQSEFELLQKESKYLAAQYDYLISKTRSTKDQRAQSKQRRKAEQQKLFKLTKTAQDNEMLQQLLDQQKVYLENFRAMVALAPVNDVRMSLMTPMDLYIHLGPDMQERRKTILKLRDEKLDVTYKYIEQKARGLDLDVPHYYFDIFDKFGKVYTTTFCINKFENLTVKQVVRLIYAQTSGDVDTLNQAMGCLTVREDLDNEKCKYKHQRLIHTMQDIDKEGIEIPDMESNSLFFCKDTPNGAVLAIDSVDKDDLYPYNAKGNNIRKDVSCGMVLSKYVNDNGEEGVIMKRFLLAKFHLHPANLPEKAQEYLMSKIPIVNERMSSMFNSSDEVKQAVAHLPPVCV